MHMHMHPHTVGQMAADMSFFCPVMQSLPVDSGSLHFMSRTVIFSSIHTKESAGTLSSHSLVVDTGNDFVQLSYLVYEGQ